MKIEEVRYALEDVEKSALRSMRFVEWAKKHLLPIVEGCHESTNYDFIAGIPYIYVYKREDLTALLTLAPIWNKESGGKRIVYCADVDGFSFRIHAADDALPPTCRVVKETKMVPAVEAHEETTETIVCDTPLS